MLDHERSVSDLRRVFAPGAFTGSQFEALGAGSNVLHRDVVTAEDLIAVELLNARVPSVVALGLLQSDLRWRISDELRKIPIAVNLGDKTARTYIEDGGPADRAWGLMTSHSGVKKAIAGKLLARKRPKLIPVYDDVVACALRGRPGFWLWLHKHLQADDLWLAHRLGNLRIQGGVPAGVSDIRIFGIVLDAASGRSPGPTLSRAGGLWPQPMSFAPTCRRRRHRCPSARRVRPARSSSPTRVAP